MVSCSVSDVAKLCTKVLAVLALEMLVVFVVLKLDGRTSVGAWSWLIVVALPLAIAGAAALAWLGLNYFSTLAYELQAEEDINPRDYLKNRRLVNVFSIENYAEAYVFRDSVLFVGFVFFIVFAFLVGATPCSACNTPYKVVAYGAAIGYAIRLGLLCYHLVYFFAHFKTMTKEVYSYQHGFDKVGDSRMFNNVIPDLYWQEGWWWSGMIDAGLFVATLALAALGSIWVSSSACALPCNRLWSYSQYLVVGIFALEGIYVVSSVLLRYMRRASGVEALQQLFNFIVKGEQSTRLDDKPGAYGTKQKAQIAAIRVGRGKLRS